VKEIERIKYNDEIELAIGPARIRKKRFYLLPTPQYQQPQAYYTQDGAVFWATCLPQQQVMQPTQLVSPVQVVHQSPNPPQNYAPPVSQAYATPVSQAYGPPPVSQQAYTAPMQQTYNTGPPVQQSYCASPAQHNYGAPVGQNYGTPVVYSVMATEPSSQSPPCMYQSKSILLLLFRFLGKNPLINVVPHIKESLLNTIFNIWPYSCCLIMEICLVIHVNDMLLLSY